MTSHTLRREDFRVRTQDGLSLRVRCVSREPAERETLVLVHGVAAPLEPTYDLPVPGYSFMESLAERGYRAVALDHRNFGLSERSKALDEEPRPALDGLGVHTLDDSVEDIRAVMEDARTRFNVPKVVLFGSSRGAIQALAAAARFPELISLAVLNNPSSLCYLAGQERGPLVDTLRAERTRHSRPETYARYTAEHQRKRWSHLFGEKLSVEGTLQDAYIAACIASDPEGARQSPPCFRVPAEGFPDRVPLVPLSGLQVPILVVEAETVPAEHVDAFTASAPPGLTRVVTIRDSDHFTLRNARRHELANLLDVAICAHRWGDRP